MDITTPKLKQHNILRRRTQNCQCSQDALIYTIPVKLDENIIGFLECMGKPAFDFKKTSILKIENSTFAITGIRRLKEIRFTLKKESQKTLETFEDALINYVRSLKER